MDDKMKEKVKREVGLAVDRVAKESRGREIPVQTVEVSVRVSGPGGKQATTRILVEPDRKP